MTLHHITWYNFLGPQIFSKNKWPSEKKMSLTFKATTYTDLPPKKRKEEKIFRVEPSITEGLEDGNAQLKMVKAQRPHISPGTVTLPSSSVSVFGCL